MKHLLILLSLLTLTLTCDQGYCLSTPCACSCKSSFISPNCSMPSSCPISNFREVTPTLSSGVLATRMEKSVDEGILELSLFVDLEVSQGNSESDSFSLWTKIGFEGKEDLNCGYPFDDAWVNQVSEDCKFDVYRYRKSIFEDECFPTVCVDAEGVVIDCLESACVNGPCRKMIQGRVMVERLYQRVAGSINLTRSSHVVLPFDYYYDWIVDVSSTVSVRTSVESARYSKREDTWEIQVVTAVDTGYKLENSEPDLLIDGFQVELSDCDMVDEECIQTMTLRNNGCESLSGEKTFTAPTIQVACASTACRLPTENSNFSFIVDTKADCRLIDNYDIKVIIFLSITLTGLIISLIILKLRRDETKQNTFAFDAYIPKHFSSE